MASAFDTNPPHTPPSAPSSSMVTVLDEITSEPPQPHLLTSDSRHHGLLSGRCRSNRLFQEGGLPFDPSRHMQVPPLPTDEELVRTQDGREETFLHRQHHAFVAHENAEHTVIDILEEGEMCVEGYVQRLDRTQQLHSRPKWTILGDSLWDSLWDVIVQGSFALVSLKTSNASPINDALIPVIAIVYSIGFLAAIGGKLRDSSVMRGIGSVAAVLGFLLTMILLLGTWASEFNLLV